MSEVVVIPERFRGPPTSGNGGYVSGKLAQLLTASAPNLPQHVAVEVTLRSPVPLDRALTVERAPDSLRITDEERAIAEARLTTLQLDPPAPPSYDEALALRPSSLALRPGRHPLLPGERLGVHPICFCCGAELAPDAGLHVYAASVPGRDLVAAAWQAPATFAEADGQLSPAMVCTALDCPGQFAWYAQGLGFALLGRMTARLDRPVRAGERCVVIGWSMGKEGRKHFAGTAIFDARGELCACAKAVWIALA
jgi:hypothetical protein